jgi:hypothetical protein
MDLGSARLPQVDADPAAAYQVKRVCRLVVALAHASHDRQRLRDRGDELVGAGDTVRVVELREQHRVEPLRVGIVTGQSAPTGVAVNSSNLYWTDTGSGTINEASLDGTSPHAVVTGQSLPASG